MSSIIKYLIEYTGVADRFPVLRSPSSFRQLSLQETLSIPEAKPDVGHIVKVTTEVVITNTKVLRTTKGASVEGQILTGFKLMVEGEVSEQIEYMADISTQAIHEAHFNIPFSTFIVLPCDFTIGTSVAVTGYIDDMHAQLIDKRTISRNTSMLLVAE